MSYLCEVDSKEANGIKTWKNYKFNYISTYILYEYIQYMYYGYKNKCMKKNNIRTTLPWVLNLN